MLAFGGTARAENYPSHPITIIVPFSAGGPSDAMARILAERMKTTLGETVLIENVTGAGGSLGVGRAVRSRARRLHHPLRPSRHPCRQRRDLQARLRPRHRSRAGGAAAEQSDDHRQQERGAGKIAEGVAGLAEGAADAGRPPAPPAPARAAISPGSISRTSPASSCNTCRIAAPAPALNDLVAGQIDLIVDQTSNSISQVRAGTIRAYAVTDDKRVEYAADIPTTDEAGLPGFHMTLWSGLWVPKGTPKEIVAKLNAAAVEALNDPAVRKQLENLGLQMPPKDQLTPEALGAWQKAEIAKWWPMIRAANVKVD